MKFITASLTFMYVGVVYFAHAEKRNIRGLADTSSATASTSTVAEPAVEIVDEEVYFIEPAVLSEEVDEGKDIDITLLLEEDDPTAPTVPTVSTTTTTAKRERKLGTVTNFDIIGKGASTPIVTTPVIVYEKEEEESSSHSGYSPSKGRGRRYYGSHGKGKGGGRYGGYGGYGGYGSGSGYYRKGKGHRYYYGGRYHHSSSESSSSVSGAYKEGYAHGHVHGGTVVTPVVKEVIEPVGKGAW